MRILVLGATGLTGTAVVRAALDAGHDVTAVHRGRSSQRGTTVPEQAHELLLDRTGGHASLASDDWDAIIDVSGYLPSIVRDAIEHLDRPDRPYVYVSTVSVYADPATPMQDEHAPVARIEDPELRERVLHEADFDWREAGLYSEVKALCEDELTAATRGPLAILRPVVIAGAHDHTWRFPYWVDRALHGGTIVAPAVQDQPVAIVDVRDLGEFAVRCAERSIEGTFNLSPLPERSTYRAMLDAVIEAAGTDAEVRWVDEDVLVAADVEPWAGLPFWLPESTGTLGMCSFDTTAAQDAGFEARPLVQTAREVREWLERTSPELLPDRGLTLTPEREAELVRQTAPASA